METRFYLAYLAKGELEDWYQEIITNLYDKFNLVELKEKKRLAHITVKDPFLAENLGDVEKIVEGLTKREEEIVFDVSGIGHFENQIVYMGAETNLKGRRYIQRILDEFKTRKYEMSRYDQWGKMLHMTVAKRKESGGRFEEVLAYLKENEKKFLVPFDNLVIMGKNRGESGIHKFFEIH